MDKKCYDEICGLHKLFEDWFIGRVPETKENFARLGQVLSADFEIIFPDGRIFTKEMIVSFMGKTYGRYAEMPFRIDIKNYRGRTLTEDLHLVTYEEWQVKDGKDEVKLSTAIFRCNEDTPCGVEWLHVHENYLP